MERNYTVYLHTSPSGKYYVGITGTSIEKRWKKNGEGYKNQVFYKAIEKYGWGNIDHEIVASNLTKEEAENFEVLLISKLHSNEKEYGYNIENGGQCIGTHSKETKEKISNSLKGRVITDEHKEKLSLALKGKTRTETFVNKLKEYYKTHEGANKGKKLSKETLEKIKTTREQNNTNQKMSGKNNHLSKPVICNNKPFESIKQCADFYKVNYRTMKYWLSGERKMRQEFIDLDLHYATEEEIKKYNLSI